MKSGDRGTNRGWRERMSTCAFSCIQGSISITRRLLRALRRKDFWNKSLVSLLLLVIFVGDIAGVFTLFTPKEVEAAQVGIDSSVSTTAAEHHHASAQTVFISDQVGYRFYVDSTGTCVYSKTSNGGTSWAAAVTVDSQTDCETVAVWYDRWTPNNFGNTIHIVTMDSADLTNDNLFYNALDTTTDTRLVGAVATNTDLGNVQTYTLAAGTNAPSITVATNGTIYIAVNDATDSAVLRCSGTCQTPGNWSEVGTNPFTNANDYSTLIPLTNDDVMVISRVIAAASEDIQSKIWTNSASAWGAWTGIDNNAPDNTTYDIGLAATLASSTVAATTTTFLVYTAQNATPGTDDDIRTARYAGGIWSTSTSAVNPTRDVLLNDTKGITNVSMGRDENTGNIYVAYNAQATANSAPTGQVYWRMSTTSMNSWSTEVGPMATGSDDLYGIDLPRRSDQRMYVSWYGITPDDIYGDTIADLVPGVVATTSGSQVATVMASTSNFYVGGALELSENISSRNVTSITIEENGTVDAQNNLQNIRLKYENDTTFPYDCASESFAGTEIQFGATSTSFNGANGSSTFTGSIAVATTSTLCLYVVLDVLDSAANGDTINILISNSSSSIVVSPTAEVSPTTTIEFVGSTQIQNDILTQAHFHWRNDDGNETTATSKTGGVEDVSLTALQQSTPARLRFEVSNEGGTTSPSVAYRIEYSIATSTCDAAYLWTDVGASDDEWNMYDSINLTEGANTTNIASGANGAVTDENTTFLTPNSGVKDTSSQTAGIVATSTQFLELEYSIVASTTAAEGNTYCFRLTDAGYELPVYTVYPRASIAADVAVTATSSQITTTDVPAANFYVGGAYVITENSDSRTVTSITISEDGSVDASVGLDNIRLYYDLDTSAPYDCASESYVGGELQFGATNTVGFSSANGTSTFNGSVTIATTSTMCVYTILDITESALNNETVNIVVSQPSLEVVVTGGGSVSPTVTRDITGSTTLRAATLTQMRYHWRNDNGPEATSTSRTAGVEGTAVSSLYESTPIRLRVEISNEGATTTPSTRFRIEYGQKITSCSAVASWTDIGDVGGAWDMYDSSFLTNGADTTNIAVNTGGVTNENTTFKTPNGGVLDTTSVSASTTVSETQYIELEYSIRQTSDAGFSTPYCFRVTKNGATIPSYTLYPELTTAPERDFKIQHGTTTVSGTSVTLVAGVNYVAPSASTSAFMRITNSSYTGAGQNAGGGTQNANNVTAALLNPWNIMTSVTIARPLSATSNTRVSWEIIEFVGKPGSDNEMIVRQQQSIPYTATGLFATGTALLDSDISDDRDIVVYITGQLNPNAGTAEYNHGLSTSSWASTTNQAVFQRGEANSIIATTSYAVVEFKGSNWKVQQVQHQYVASGATETEDITAVNSTTRTFLHAQKRVGNLAGTDEYGHQVWLNSVGQVSFRLETGATSPNLQTTVVWIIENTQTSTGAMLVTRSNYSSTGGAEPLTTHFDIGTTISDVENTSIEVTNNASSTTSLFPRPILGVTLTASTTQFQIWRSDTGAAVNFRAEVVEWPVAGTVLRQNKYQFFVDNDALLPTDPWPAGGADLGESTVLTDTNEPLGGGERLRIRMTIAVINSSLPETSQDFRLQYGERVTSCSAIGSGNWFTLGDSASTTSLWRGYAAPGITDGTSLSGDPPTGGDLKILSVDGVAGSFEEENDSVTNPYRAEENQDIEYDWLVEQNDASADTMYCFRMVKADGSTLDGYLDYPQARTAPFSPVSQNWRWYDDEGSVTPASPLGVSENSAPIDIADANILKLRITARETENVKQDDARFRLQFSEYSDFSTSTEMVSTTTCTGGSLWCYATSSVADNTNIQATVLTDSDSCVAGVGRGCGTYNESSRALTGHTHAASSSAEYDFTIRADGPRVNRTYYFRMYDVLNDVAVPLGLGESYPSLTTEGANLVFSTGGLATSTPTEGITTDIATTPTGIAYGTLTPNVILEAAQRFTVTTNATAGYKMLMYSDSPFISSHGESIRVINASNTAPLAWATACDTNAYGCYGYHAGDDALEGGSTRFAPPDTYAAFESTPREVAYSSIPVSGGDTVDVVYRVLGRDLQQAGQYETTITFITLPAF